MKKHITIDQLRTGMYIAGLGQSWFKTPFLRHRWLIKRSDEISLLREFGIQELIIDSSKGLDISDTHGWKDVSQTPQAKVTEGSEIHPGPDSAMGSGPNPEEIQIVNKLRAEAIFALDNIFQSFESGIEPRLADIRNIVSTLLDGLLEHQAAMLSLIQMRSFDQNLSLHAVDTCVLSLAIGESHGFDIPKLKALGLGALLHDIGQLRLPRNLLRKRERLTEHDQKLMRTHPEMGLAFLCQLPDVPEDAKRIMIEHHERLDGSGYPKGLQGEEISPLSRVLAVADTYDAQIIGRCSSPPVPPAQALRELYREGIKGQLDLASIQHLIQFLGIYPVGSLVELNTGERAVVVWVHSDTRLKPSVKIIADTQGHIIPEPSLMEIATPKNGGPERTITRSLDPYVEHIDISRVLDSLW